MLRQLYFNNVSNYNAEFYCAKTQLDRFEKKVDYVREIDSIVGKHIKFPTYVTRKHECYIDKQNGNKFRYIMGTLQELNDSDEIYVIYGSSASFLGNNKRRLEEFVKEHDYIYLENTLLLLLVIIGVIWALIYVPRMLR